MSVKIIAAWLMWLGTVYLKAQNSRLYEEQNTARYEKVSSTYQKHYRFGNLKISPDGRYAAVRKWYHTNRDTTEVYDIRKPEIPVLTLVRRNNAFNFIGSYKLLAFGEGTAELIDLNTGHRKEWTDIAKAEWLEKSRVVMLWKKDRTLVHYYTATGKTTVFENVLQWTVDNKGTVYVLQQLPPSTDSVKMSVILEITEKETREVYRTASAVFRFEMLPAGKYLAVTEITEKPLGEDAPSAAYSKSDQKVKTSQPTISKPVLPGASSVSLVLLGCSTPAEEKKRLIKMDMGIVKNLRNISITENAGGREILIDLQWNGDEEKTVPEIWYANDGNLKAKKEGFVLKHQYFYVKTGNTTAGERATQFEDRLINLSAGTEVTSGPGSEEYRIIKIPSGRFPMLAPMNRENLLLAFDPYTGYRYDTRFPVLNVYGYNVQTGESVLLAENSQDLAVSPDGRHLLNFRKDRQKWEIIDTFSRKKTVLPVSGIRKPVFTPDGRMAFFESNEGLWQLDLNKGNLKMVTGTLGKQSSISGTAKQPLTTFNNINAYTVRSEEQTVVQLRDDGNRTGIKVFGKGRWENLIRETSNLITDIAYVREKDLIFSVEENFNLPSQLVVRNTSNGNLTVLASGNGRDKTVRKLRMEMVCYTDAHGHLLKGLLYYPENYPEHKTADKTGNLQPQQADKFPIVVRIYEKQHTLANVYYFPNADPVGFDLRTLLSKGYFVYLPDIRDSEVGSGLSALDCVQRALDALKNHQGIDFEKIGLTGHSMGGYETAFIAAHSDRFAAYIVGSAHTDLVRAYYSIHGDSGLPYMWQFENGQHEMTLPFSENRKKYLENSPIYNAEKINTPMLLWTGKKDENVEWTHTVELYTAMVRYGKPVVMLLYPKGDHNLGKDTEESRDLNRRSLEWWDYFLKDKRDISWIRKGMEKGR